MSNLTVRINLRQLKHEVKEILGKTAPVKCLIIPIVENNLFEGEKSVYLDLSGYEIRDRVQDRKDTHLLKQSFSKPVYEAMSEEQRRNLPIIGNVTVFSGEPMPQRSSGLNVSSDITVDF